MTVPSIYGVARTRRVNLPMRNILFLLFLFTTCLPLHSLAQCNLSVQATVLGSTPAPLLLSSAPGGDYTFSSGGVNPGQPGGRTWMFSNVNDAPYGSLWWTFDRSVLTNPRHTSQPNPTGNMDFLSFNPATGIATFTSSAPLSYQTAFGTENIFTRLRVQFQPFTGTHSGPLTSGWLTPVSAASAGISFLPGNWPVIDVKSLPGGNNYQVWFALETVTGIPLLQYYDTPPHQSSIGGNVNTSVGGSFIATAPACSNTTTVTVTATGGTGNYSGTGTFQVNPGPRTFSVTSANGCTGSTTVNVPSNGLHVEAGSYGPLCSNNAPVVLGGIPSGGTWSGPGVTGNLFNPSAAGPGTHTLNYSVENAETGCSGSDNAIVVVNPAPVFNPIPTTFCSNDNTQYLATTGPVSVVNNAFGIGFSGSTGAFNVLFRPANIPAGPNFFTVVFGNGCSSTFNYTIQQAAVLNLTQPNYSVCLPSTFNLETVLAPSSILPPGTTLSYLLNGVPVSNPAAINQSGTYTISALTPDGCVTEKEVTVTFNPSPVFNPIPTTFCSNDNTQYLATTGPVSVVNNAFGIGFSGSTGAFNVLFRPSNIPAGPNFFTVVFSNGCSSTFNYTILQAASLQFTQPSITVCSPQTANLQTLIAPSSILPQGTILEFLLNGVPVNDPASISVPGTYTVRATTPDGCVSEKDVVVTINQPPVFNPIPTTFCSNDNTQYLATTGPVSVVNNAFGIGFSGSTGAFNVLFRPANIPAGPNFFTVVFSNGCSSTFNYTIQQAAVLNLTQPNYSVCLPSTFNLETVLAPSSILPAGTILSYLFNGVPVDNPAAVNQTGTYTIRATTSQGCVTEKAVTVTFNPSPVFNNIPTSFCSNDNTQYLATTGPVSVVNNAFGIGFSGSTGAFNVLFRPANIPPGPNFFTVVFTTGCSATFNYVIDPPPTLSNCPSNITTTVDDATCGAVVQYTPPTATNTCGGVLTRTAGPASGSVFPVGTTTVTYTLTQLNGPAQTCSFTVTVIDNLGPIISCITNETLTTVTGKCGAFYSKHPEAFDNCGTVTLTGVRNDNLPLDALYPVGTTRITWTARDASGNARSCFQDILVLDGETPSIDCAPDVVVSADNNKCSALVQLVNPTAHDNCGVVSLTGVRSDNLPLNAAYPVGSTSISWTAKDANGNSAGCIQTVTVSDNELPVIVCPPPIQLNNDPGKCGAVVNLSTPPSHDNCGVQSITNNHPDAFFAVGNTIVTWTVTDVHGNTSSCAQSITVSDNEKPKLTCPQVPVLCFNATGNYSIPVLIATDNCAVHQTSYVITGATSRSGNGNNASGIFNPGVSFITWTVTDTHGNSNACQTRVQVDQLLTLVVPDAMALPIGVDPNTVYLGYDPAESITMTAIGGGGTPPYNYLWSNGQTTPSITVNPVVTTVYTVTITDALGCTKTVSKSITVVDVRCGNNGDKVMICKVPSGNPEKSHTICVSANAVRTHLGNGSYLGPCDGQSLTQSRGEPVHSKLELSIAAYPNPTRNSFTIQAMVPAGEKAQLVIYDALGKIMESRSMVSGSLVVGANYRPGIYYAELRMGDQKSSLKLVRQSD